MYSDLLLGMSATKSCYLPQDSFNNSVSTKRLPGIYLNIIGTHGAVQMQCTHYTSCSEMAMSLNTGNMQFVWTLPEPCRTVLVDSEINHMFHYHCLPARKGISGTPICLKVVCCLPFNDGSIAVFDI